MKGKIHIHIGEVHASKEPAVIETVLGSCVSVCLYDPVTCVGGMNHIFLPGSADFTNIRTVERYGSNAIEGLISRIMALGGSLDRLVAKAFGGARILPSLAQENGMGDRNVEFVLGYLKAAAIPLVRHDFGGNDTRRVSFHTDTGEVLLKRIPRIGPPSMDNQEQ